MKALTSTLALLALTSLATDAAAQSWFAHSPMPTARHRHAAAVAKVSGVRCVFAFGGTDGGLTTYGTTEMFNPVSNSWTTKAPMPAPKSGMAAATAHDGVSEKVFLFGGSAGGNGDDNGLGLRPEPRLLEHRRAAPRAAHVPFRHHGARRKRLRLRRLRRRRPLLPLDRVPLRPGRGLLGDDGLDAHRAPEARLLERLRRPDLRRRRREHERGPGARRLRPRHEQLGREQPHYDDGPGPRCLRPATSRSRARSPATGACT